MLFERYRQLHNLYPEREFYFVHTSRKELEIQGNSMVGYPEGGMQLEFRDNLPFVRIQVNYQGKTIHLSSILIDTGSVFFDSGNRLFI